MTRARGIGLLGLITIALAAVVVGIGTDTPQALLGRSPGLSMTAHFASAPGLYVGNNVSVLGVPVGRVTKITPSWSDVAVEMTVRPGVRIPSEALAVLTSPTVVSDRVVQLAPPYTGGAQMSNGATIPVERTRAPVEVDQILKSADELANAFGPNGANQTGTVSDLLHVSAQNLAGNGQNTHDTIVALAATLPSIAQHGTQVTALLTDLDTLAKALADHDSTVSALYSDLGTATGELAAERQDLAAALANLSVVMQAVVTFIEQNKSTLSADVQNLQTVASALVAHQKQLTEAVDVLPLALTNFANTVDTSDPANPRIRVRYNANSGPGQLDFVRQVCGQDAYPHIVKLGAGTGTTFDLLCAALFGVLQEPAPPGAPPPPDFGLQKFLP